MNSADTGSSNATGYRLELLKATREELARADSKAALLLTGSSVAAGAFLSGLVAGQWSPHRLIGFAQVMWWVGLVAAAAAMISLALAAYPRTRRSGDHDTAVIAFYGDVVGLSTAELDAGLTRDAEHPQAMIADQIREVARIVAAKYRFLEAAFLATGVAAVLCAGALITDAVLSGK